MGVGLGHYLVVGAILFSLGVAGIFLTVAMIIIMMSIELMLLAGRPDCLLSNAGRFDGPGVLAVDPNGCCC